MSQQQLKLVLELKVREEHAALEQFKLAQQQVQLAQQKQAQLEAYREQYIVQLTQPDAQLSVQQITQIQRFISKLDQACAAQAAQFSKAVLVKDQRQTQWQQCQQKCRALEKLISSKDAQANTLRLRKEQKNHDDFALQQLLRTRK